MHYGLHVGPVGELADVRTLIRLAQESKVVGWDRIILWDQPTLGLPDPVADPWLALTAVALHTERLHLGPRATPLARRLTGLLPTGLGFATWTFALRRTSAGRMGAMIYLIPPIAVLLSWAILGETPPWLAVAGGALCLGGVYLVRRD